MVERSSEAPRLGGKQAVLLFVCTLLAFTAESQLTQYVQTNLEYKQTFFIFYTVHSSFLLIFPLHLLYLRISSRHSPKSLLKGIATAVRAQSTDQVQHTSHEDDLSPLYSKEFLLLIFYLTIGITLPGLLWFISVTRASISDVTAIWNTNAFFAYLISVKLMKVKLEMRRLIPVIIATLGVIIVVYGGSTSASDPQKPSISVDKISRPSAPLVGDLLTLAASVIYALYQVLYKKYAALPSDPELHDSDRSYEQLVTSDSDASLGKGVYPPPFGLHATLVTSLLGLATFLILGIFIPVLHYTGVEPFRLPPDLFTLLTVMGIAASGVMFNAGYMVLLGLWGPVITSVGGLLTIVLVFISDLIFGMGGAVSLWSILGSTAIIAAFGILSYDMLQKR